MLNQASPLACLAALSLIVAGCGDKKASNPAPLRLTAPVTLSDRSSTIRMPIGLPLADLQAILNREVPLLLHTIDEPQQVCIKTKSKLLPDITCRLTGQVRRGPITVSGQGDALTLTIPVRATVSARNIGKLIKSETATGAIQVKARVRLGLAPNWRPTARIDANYDWTNEIGVNFLGRRITFASKVDPKLRTMLAQLERSLPGELARLQLREKVQTIWAKGFTSVRVKTDPLIWARFTPQQIGFSGYRVENGKLVVGLSAKARTETLFGERPPDPPVTPLPNLMRALPPEGINVHVPVLVRYTVLEAIARKVLAARPQRSIQMKGGGTVDATFNNVTIYGTPGNGVAVGFDLSLKTLGGALAATGTVWFVGKPALDIEKKVVGISDLTLSGATDNTAFNMLVDAINQTALRGRIIEAVRYDFSKDYADGLEKADRWLNEEPFEGFVFKGDLVGAKIIDVKIAPDGFLVEADAQATGAMTYDPARAAQLVAERRRKRVIRERAAAAAAAAKAPSGLTPAPR